LHTPFRETELQNPSFQRQNKSQWETSKSKILNKSKVPISKSQSARPRSPHDEKYRFGFGILELFGILDFEVGGSAIS
jgi:hypothetical protein